MRRFQGLRMDKTKGKPATGEYDVAAFVWPSFTGNEPRTRMFWPDGEGEWQTVRTSASRFPGHAWPQPPLWGYCNEADPRVMEMQIDAAAGHGINVFIYDWYWYDGGPFLEQCLNDGYLGARNNDRVKFYLMWANHDVTHLWDKRISRVGGNVIWRGAIDRREFEVIDRRWIERYFTHYNFRGYRRDARSSAEALVNPAPEWEWVAADTTLAYFPQVSIGWDNNPRFGELQPDTQVSTPEQFREALVQARAYADCQPRRLFGFFSRSPSFLSKRRFKQLGCVRHAAHSTS
jgi:hypothetical protein